MYDGNGNVGQMVNAENGELEAFYEYDPFGNLINSAGAYAEVNPFRFSTKYFDNETRYLYFGHRYYMPELGRWVNRDPITEKGFHALKKDEKDKQEESVHLYAFVENSPISLTDPLGLKVYLCNVPHASIKIESKCYKSTNGQWGFAQKKNDSLIDLFVTGIKSLAWWVEGEVTAQDGISCKEIYNDDSHDKEVYSRILKDINNTPCYNFQVFNCYHWGQYVLGGYTSWRRNTSMKAKNAGMCF